MRVTSRADVLVALSLVVMFMLYMMLLDARVLRAQETTMMDTTMMEETTILSESVCAADEELVDTVSGQDDLRTEEFEIDGPEWRFVSEATTNTDTSGSLSVDALDDEGFTVVGGFTFQTVFPDDGLDTQSSGIIDGPGTFRLDIEANGVDYEVSICQTPGQGGGTNEDTDENTDENEDTNEDTDDDGVIDNTIPKKPLPDTGGSTALMVGGSALLLLYGSLVAWRLKTRER